MLKIGLLGMAGIGTDDNAVAENEFAERIEIPVELVRRPRDSETSNGFRITNDFETFFSKEIELVL